MKLNHLNLCTSNVLSVSDIFTRYFAFKVIIGSEDSAMLSGRDGFSLVLTKIDTASSQTYPSSFFPQINMHFNFHVGFMMDTPELVLAKHQELKEAGLDPGAINEYVALNENWTAFYCAIGDGIDIEVNAHTPVEAK